MESRSYFYLCHIYEEIWNLEMFNNLRSRYVVELGFGPAFRIQVLVYYVILDLLCWFSLMHSFMQQIFG